jgi:UDP-N-acetylmuramoyl-L-alanyl-D-glutamate--2,6-diaminopimelate ligase
MGLTSHVLAAPRRLGDLLSEVSGVVSWCGDPQTPVSGVCLDSREVTHGDVFVAIPGFTRNGLEFVPQALARGACAIVAESDPGLADMVPTVVVESARAALGDLASAVYDHPSRKLAVVGITGTDGKTSTAQLLSAILEARGLSTGWLSTVSTKIGSRLDTNPPDRTTPEAPVVQAGLAEMAAAGVDVAIVETSSHALTLQRVRGVRYQVAIFTNLSPEHLNFHGTFEAYRDAKAELFARLPLQGLAVLNADDPHATAMAARTRARVAWYALDHHADVRAEDVQLSPSGTHFTLLERGQAEGRRIESALVGRFNVCNWLAAYTAARRFGATADDLAAAAARQPPVPGRMNLVDCGQPFAVVVDFAHTPQALERALNAVRSLAQGRVILMFGLAGGRDAANRPVMGELACRRADFSFITSDDAYDENPADIAEQVARGARSAGGVEGHSFAVVLDRRTALRAALRMAQPGDVVLFAGHGHEQTLKVAGENIPWNDARVAAEELARLGFGGPP